MIASKSAVGFAAVAAAIAMSSAGVATSASAHDNKTVQCFGVNACKGQSDCKSGKHDCKGLNDCKGQGFKDLSASACAAQGGSQTPPQ
jgi:uncharacterized membrane protein